MQRGVGGRLKNEKKNWPGPDGWDTSRWYGRLRVHWEVDVISAQFCSCARAIFSRVILSWSDRSIPLIIVDDSPNMHNTGSVPDCCLLSVTNGSICIPYLTRPYLARYSEIFKKPNFQVIKWKSTLIWKMLSQAELETEGSHLATIFGFPPTPQCNLDCLKSGSKRDTNETLTCAVPVHAPQTNALWWGEEGGTTKALVYTLPRVVGVACL